jgi:hypothetical protein
MSWTYPARIDWGLFLPVELRGGVILEVICPMSEKPTRAEHPRWITAGSRIPGTGRL